MLDAPHTQEALMAKLASHVKFTARPGRGDDLLAAVDRMVDAALDEPDTLVYAVHRDLQDGDVVWMYELYASEDGLDAHGGSDAAAAFGAQLDDLLAVEPEAAFTRPIRAKGLAVEW